METAKAASALTGFTLKLNLIAAPMRQYLPKGTNLSVYSQQELDAITDSLNTRPRATHNCNTPLAVFSCVLTMAQQPPNSF
jgi:transposase, IS30 family